MVLTVHAIPVFVVNVSDSIQTLLGLAGCLYLVQLFVIVFVDMEITSVVDYARWLSHDVRYQHKSFRELLRLATPPGARYDMRLRSP